MTLAEVTLAVLVLLLTPGPTNTLIAIAGAERGWHRTLPLTGAEIAGYLTTVVPLVIVGHRMLAAAPVLRDAITIAAALWVLWLGLRMWRLPAPTANAGAGHVTARMVYVTTVLNPKALIFGLVLLPAPAATGVALHLAVFVVAIAAVAALWAGLGAALTARGGGLPPPVRRAAALWLMAAAVWLAARGSGFVA